MHLSQVGDSRVRTDVSDTKIDLSKELTVITTPFGVSVTIQCIYSTVIKITSNPFDVEPIEITGTQISHGNLGGGFTMTLLDTSVDPPVTPLQLFLGDILTVTVKWSLTTLSDLSFYFNNCEIRQGSEIVKMVKDSCFSSILMASKGADSDRLIRTFKYKTFAIDEDHDEDETALPHQGDEMFVTKQTLVCDLKLCADGAPCAMAATDDDCPRSTDNDDNLFHYTMLGYIMSS